MMIPLIDIRARIYDTAHDPLTHDVMTIEEDGGQFAVALKLPPTAKDQHTKCRDVVCRRQDRHPHFGEYRSQGYRSKRPQAQDPDFLVHVVKEPDSFFSRGEPSSCACGRRK
jgi:hypothetical protein